jgi:glyoxylase I family protein
VIRGIHHISLHTANFDRQVQFYREAFGFVPVADEMHFDNFALFDQIVGVEGSKVRQVMLKASNCFIELFEWAAPEGRTGPALNANDRGYTHFCVDVTDIEAEYDRLSALGMTFAHPNPVSVGPFKSVYGRDPDGNIIEIQQVPDGNSYSLESLETVSLDP